jgi:peptidylprolyl isomerase
VATSRRRERELARRRFERRRQAELERRARAKRRNTVVGASVGTLAVIAGIVILVITLSGGSDKKKPAAKPGISPSATVSPPIAGPPKKCAKISPDPAGPGQPKVPQVTGKAPTKLVVNDIKKGNGAVAKKGSKLQLTYIGFSCMTGKQFDPPPAGKSGTPLSFTVGTGQVIPGWDQGLVGMKVGGERELVIPAKLAYQSQAGPTGVSNDTLIFVIDLLKA